MTANKAHLMQDNIDQDGNTVRVDKWLWCARFFKTRRLAADAVSSGRVKKNGRRLKPSATVAAGDVLSVRRGPYNRTVTVLAVTLSRGSAAAAAGLYAEHEESIRARRMLAEQLKANNAGMPQSRGRPTKRDRRELIRHRRRLKTDD
jgi:ribosome-associated heat shock protein Hsp15